MLAAGRGPHRRSQAGGQPCGVADAAGQPAVPVHPMKGASEHFHFLSVLAGGPGSVPGLDPGCRAMFFVAAPWFSTSGRRLSPILRGEANANCNNLCFFFMCSPGVILISRRCKVSPSEYSCSLGLAHVLRRFSNPVHPCLQVCRPSTLWIRPRFAALLQPRPPLPSGLPTIGHVLRRFSNPIRPRFAVLLQPRFTCCFQVCRPSTLWIRPRCAPNPSEGK